MSLRANSFIKEYHIFGFKMGGEEDCFLQNNIKDLDRSYKMGFDFWDCYGRETLFLLLNYAKLIDIFAGISETTNLHFITYRIYPAIRQVFCPSRMTSNN